MLAIVFPQKVGLPDKWHVKLLHWWVRMAVWLGYFNDKRMPEKGGPTDCFYLSLEHTNKSNVLDGCRRIICKEQSRGI